jgi:putative redox protein
MGLELHALLLNKEVRMAVEAVKKIGGFKYEINVCGHKLITDVSENLGGSDSGPEPHAILESALAACTAVTMQMYAEQNGIPLVCSDVKVKIVHQGPVNKIHREITLVGELLTEDQRQLLFEVAEECPMHQFLTRGAHIDTTLRSPELFVGL